MEQLDLKIAIIGAGIGGLTLALALREHGIDAQLYEQTDELREVGAAVALSANATRFYERMGLRAAFDAVCAEIPALIYRDGRSGEVIGQHRGEPSYREQFGGSYWGVHRADLQAVLSTAVGLERIHLSHRLTDLVQHPDRVSLSFANGRRVDADLVIGADGARSITRRWMLGYDDALYSGCSGFRGVVPAGRMDLLPDPEAIQFWVGPQGHLLHYPIGDKGDQNFLLVERHPSPWSSRDWVTPASEGEQLRLFKDWHPAVVQMITAMPRMRSCRTMARAPISRSKMPWCWPRSWPRRARVAGARRRRPTSGCGGAARARCNLPRYQRLTCCICRTDPRRKRAMPAFAHATACCIIWTGFTISTPLHKSRPTARAAPGFELRSSR